MPGQATFSVRTLCSSVSVVKESFNKLTTETQRAPRLQRDSNQIRTALVLRKNQIAAEHTRMIL